MHTGMVVWLDGPPKAEIDGAGVKVYYRSGGVEFVNRMSRADFHNACECGLRLLGDAETAEVIPFPLERTG